MSNRVCLNCDEPIVGPWAFRVRIGGISYDDIHGACFVQDPGDNFRDHTKTKWVCRKCAEQIGLYIADLELDACRIPEGETICGSTFEPVESENSEQVLLVEWGCFCPSNKEVGPREVFTPEQSAHVHFNCACDGWGLPLWSIPMDDAP